MGIRAIPKAYPVLSRWSVPSFLEQPNASTNTSARLDGPALPESAASPNPTFLAHHIIVGRSL